MTWLRNSPGSCPAECAQWVYHILGDCVCNQRDSVSLLLGLASVFFWATAEIPQIVTNFLMGSTEGISLAFLLTWTVGDIFNLVGCLFEPATLPTQFYMAVMYTVTTLVLVYQSIYYGWINPTRHKVEVLQSDGSVTEALLSQQQQQEGSALVSDNEAAPRLGADKEAEAPSLAAAAPADQGPSDFPGTGLPVPSTVISVPVPALTRTPSSSFIHSARSLASSQTPIMGSFMPGSHHHVGSLLSQSPGVGFSHVSLRQEHSHTSMPRSFNPQGSLFSRSTPFSLPRTSAFSPPTPEQSPSSSLAPASSMQPEGGGNSNSSSRRSSFTATRAFLSLGMLLVVVGQSSPFSSSSSSSSISSSSISSMSSSMSSSTTSPVTSGPLFNRLSHSLGLALNSVAHPISQSAATSAPHSPRRVLLSLEAGPGSQDHSTVGPRQQLVELLSGWKAGLGLRNGASASVGEILGWLMAAIYMGGRLPQIYLNIKRGTVEGLSPTMFLFALLGNVTYVGSILVRSLAWRDISPNLPWIVDASVCVLLDLFILSQFIYFSLKDAQGQQEEQVEGTGYEYK